MAKRAAELQRDLQKKRLDVTEYGAKHEKDIKELTGEDVSLETTKEVLFATSLINYNYQYRERLDRERKKAVQ